ncbi:MAG: GTPase/DUF3482 domain-containing protein [Planctomycetes bacterium]|nr:GTPase/DUF3482 domain-containing protein [Planctomycetota bacterium]
MSESLPRFVVVGNVNQGKSSVVAALTEDEAVPIDSYPGTTRRSAEYVFGTAERPLFRIVDTPGFQRARHFLARLASRAPNAAERPAAIRLFLADPAIRVEFPDEVGLLDPILAGAGILYVVDASSPVEPANEAEMEILRWTGQPAMALLNRVRARDHGDAWRPVLRQFFHIVREFDAHRARFPDRIALLRGFREIRPEWSDAIDAAVAAMEREGNERCNRSATAIADLVVEALTHVVRRPFPESADETNLRAELDAAYRDAQRRFETVARDAIETIHRHPGLTREDPELDLLANDLFSATTLKLFGLSRNQLMTYTAIGGAATGGAIDLATLGHTFMMGASIGAVVGAVAGWFMGTQVASAWTNTSQLARALFPFDTGRFLALGPVNNARYAWVLVDRALVHYRAVRDRSHARRDGLGRSEVGAGIAAELPRALRDPLDAALRRLMKEALGSRAPGPDARRELEVRLLDVLRQLPPRG